MLADYIIDHLCEIGVLSVLPDGSVAGVANDPKTRAGNKRPNISTDWKSTWPPEEALLAAIKHPCRFREIQEALEADGHASGHWFCLHALWSLEKRGLAKKCGKEYVAISSTGGTVIDVDDEESEEDRIIGAICEMCEAPGLRNYYPSKVLSMLDERFDADESRTDEWCTKKLRDLIANEMIPDLPIKELKP